ncbi:MAG: putative Ig domain-containing protein [Nitrospirota bacterium]
MKRNIKKSFVSPFRPFTHSPIHRKEGFTLIELAMVLVVIGLLIGLGMGLIGPLTKRAKLIETRETVKAVYESILGYAASNKKFPTDLSVLGIRTTDAYNRPLFYNAINVTNLCTSTATYLTVNDNSSGTPQTKNNVAFILLGEGENRTNDTGSASPFTIKEQGVDDYDDIVMYADIDKLRSQICTSFKITTESLPIGTEEMAYPSTTLEATDGTPLYTWGIQSGSLPAGLTLSSAGVISGTPTTDGSYNFTVRVCDNDDTNPPDDCPPTTNKDRLATKSLTITINPNKPRITTEILNYGTVNQSYAATLSATGGLSPYSWNIPSGLPTGLTLKDTGTCGSFTCTASTPCICGTPTTAGTFTFTPTITDSRSRTASKTLSIAINAAAAAGSPTCSLTANPSSMQTPGTTVLTWSINNGPANGTWSGLPAGGTCTNFSGSSGGSCTTGTITTTTTITLTVTNAQGSSQCAATVYVGVPPGPVPSCTLEASPNPVTIGNPTSLIWTISNGPASVSCTSSPTTGLCSSGSCNPSSSYGGNCTTSAINTNTTFQLAVTNANGTGFCATTAYVTSQDFCSTITVRNVTGGNIYVKGGQYGTTCRRIRDNRTFNVNYSDTTRVTLWQNSSCTSNPQDIDHVSYSSSIPADAYAASTDADRDCAVALDEVATNDWELVDE